MHPDQAQPKFAIVNQVNFHLHVVAGAMHVLRALSTAPIAVYLTDKVLNHNHFGFMEWITQTSRGFEWRDCEQIDCNTAYDLVWFISPEWDVAWTAQTLKKMQHKLALLYVHNGHMPEDDWQVLRQEAVGSPHVPLLTMSPHVAEYVSKRLQQDSNGRDAGQPAAADWVLPIWPYQPEDATAPVAVQDSNQQQHSGFVISGSMDKALRDYDKMWEQVRACQEQQGLQNFQLKILGDMYEGFEVPADIQQLVTVHKTLPDRDFYRVVYSSCAIVPALGNPAYYTCKLTSAIITSLMAGVPIIADSQFLAAYRMLEPDAVFHQGAAETEMDVMLQVASMPAAEVAVARAAVERVRTMVNDRAVQQIAGWLQQAAGYQAA